MPAKSLQQLKWVNSPSVHKALGAAGVKEWDTASKGLNLPPRVGALRRAAQAPNPSANPRKKRFVAIPGTQKGASA